MQFLKYGKQFLICLALFLLQYTLIVRFKIWGVVPNVLLAYVIVTAASKEMGEAIFTALFLGLLTDLTANRFFGYDLLFFLYAAVIVNLICDKVVHSNFMFATLFTMGANLLYAVFFYWINNVFAGDHCFFSYVLRHGLFSSLYIGVLTLVVTFFLDRRLFHAHRRYVGGYYR